MELEIKKFDPRSLSELSIREPFRSIEGLDGQSRKPSADQHHHGMPAANGEVGNLGGTVLCQTSVARLGGRDWTERK